MASNTLCTACNRSFEDEFALAQHHRDRHPPRPEDLASSNITTHATPTSPPPETQANEAVAVQSESPTAETPEATSPSPQLTPRRILTSPSPGILRMDRTTRSPEEVASLAAAANALLSAFGFPSVSAGETSRNRQPGDTEERGEEDNGEPPARRRRTRSVHWADGDETITYADTDPPATITSPSSVAAGTQVATTTTTTTAPLSDAPRQMSLSDYTARRRAEAAREGDGGDREEEKAGVEEAEEASSGEGTSSDASVGETECTVEEVTAETQAGQSEEPEDDEYDDLEEGEVKE